MGTAIAKIEKREDNGFAYNYCAPKSGETKGVVFILHGDRSSPDRWSRRIRQVHKALPDVAVIAIQGPVKQYNQENPEEQLYGWLNISGAKNIAKGLLSHIFTGLPVAAQINGFIDGKMKDFGLKAENICLIGTSMGGVVGVQSAITSKESYGAVIASSTAVLPGSKAKTRPEIYMPIVKGDEVFDKPVKEIDPRKKGLKRAFNKAAINAATALNFDKSLARLEKNDVPVVVKVYEVTGRKTAMKDRQGNDIKAHKSHKTTDTMWFDSIAYAAQKLNLRLHEDVNKMVYWRKKNSI